MRPTRYSTSRQKACHQCAAAKAKCDRKAECCTRCEQRGLSCTYPQYQSSPQPTDGSGDVRPGLGTTADTPSNLPSPAYDASNDASILSTAGYSSSTIEISNGLPRHVPLPPISEPGQTADQLDFSNLDLICPINPDDIANRWLNNFVPLPGQKVKEYSPNIAAFIHRILKSYANASVHGTRIPPFIHWSQLSSPSSLPLSTCLSVIKICDRPLPGSAGVAAEVLQREMTKLYEKKDEFDDFSLLAAFQAYLIYAMVIFFRLGRDYDPFLRQAMMNAQELACAASRNGLTCAAEQQGARPRWEAWIVAEAKRRTLFTMCMLDSALLRHDGLPSHLAIELRGLLAPGSKSLWVARERHDWEIKYNVHLATWNDGGLRIDELWPMPQDFGESDIERQRDRVDLWLEDLDEYGTMMYAVTSCTHGG
ncbi:uncharacterized protein CTRU02_204853 [Colletotrichum truncatum]|uniref:Uncharacterized protein n=1 Tax=Colletotrichum truncatum TaxID=5467 RepID=A0ACC3ZDJ2_COLTU|nr:uncharacterized protein CTRU02_03088 [Colletotrichum truncatum]KAF6798046.1 hypothetical protein CTRU02_03088 [Colletotrichum truncatum]